MSIYSYRKAPVVSIPGSVATHSRLSRLLPSALILVGGLLIANVAWPILSYQFLISPYIQKTNFVSPIPQDQLGNRSNLPSTGSGGSPQVLGSELDYTNAKNWFPSARFTLNQPIETYSIDIPALNISHAQVTIGGEDLSQSLIHFPDTAKPGQPGAPVIFGHSTLRQFYNPSESNSDRYVSIFSKIMTLKNGDRIYIDYDGIRYTYEVSDKVEVQPDDLFILEQQLNRRELKLITCVPEGTYLRRGVVTARLVDLGSSDLPN
jgi:sortase A